MKIHTMTPTMRCYFLEDFLRWQKGKDKPCYDDKIYLLQVFKDSARKFLKATDSKQNESARSVLQDYLFAVDDKEADPPHDMPDTGDFVKAVEVVVDFFNSLKPKK